MERYTATRTPHKVYDYCQGFCRNGFNRCFREMQWQVTKDGISKPFCDSCVLSLRRQNLLQTDLLEIVTNQQTAQKHNSKNSNKKNNNKKTKYPDPVNTVMEILKTAEKPLLAKEILARIEIQRHYGLDKNRIYDVLHSLLNAEKIVKTENKIKYIRYTTKENSAWLNIQRIIKKHPFTKKEIREKVLSILSDAEMPLTKKEIREQISIAWESLDRLLKKLEKEDLIDLYKKPANYRATIYALKTNTIALSRLAEAKETFEEKIIRILQEKPLKVREISDRLNIRRTHNSYLRVRLQKMKQQNILIDWHIGSCHYYAVNNVGQNQVA